MKRRVLGFGDCCYHICSRINEDRYYLEGNNRSLFLDLMKRVAVFSGVEILTFCIMSNHFHILVRVPAVTSVSDKELLRRLRCLYTAEEYEHLCAEFDDYKRRDDYRMMQLFRERYTRRMHDLSQFMSSLKQRFSIGFNKRMSRHGPLWDGRFRSVLVQSSSDQRGQRALSVVASYIDLNAVRAGLVDTPGEYAWCGYACAVNGCAMSRKGIGYVMRRASRGHAKSALRSYCRLLQMAAAQNSRKVCDDRIQDGLRVGIALPLSDFLRCRVSHLSRGWIFGDKSFVEFVAHRRPECFPFARRDCAVSVDELKDYRFFSMLHRPSDAVDLNSRR